MIGIKAWVLAIGILVAPVAAAPPTDQNAKANKAEKKSEKKAQKKADKKAGKQAGKRAKVVSEPIVVAKPVVRKTALPARPVVVRKRAER